MSDKSFEYDTIVSCSCVLSAARFSARCAAFGTYTGLIAHFSVNFNRYGIFVQKRRSARGLLNRRRHTKTTCRALSCNKSGSSASVTGRARIPDQLNKARENDMEGHGKGGLKKS